MWYKRQHSNNENFSAIDLKHTGPAEVRSNVMAKYISFTSDSFSHKYTCKKGVQGNNMNKHLNGSSKTQISKAVFSRNILKRHANNNNKIASLSKHHMWACTLALLHKHLSWIITFNLQLVSNISKGIGAKWRKNFYILFKTLKSNLYLKFLL